MFKNVYIWVDIIFYFINILYIDHLGSFCIFGKKFHDPLEIFHDPLPGRDPSVEKHCSKL